MFTYNERDLHRMPTPARSHLPMKDFIAASGILDDEANSAHNNDADVALLRLPAPSLRGTFAKAYALLAKLVSQIGWDELLKCRSQVFVMEEEYRMQKAADPAPDSPAGLSRTNGVNGAGDDEEEKEGFGPLAIEEDEADDDASTKALHSETPANAAAPVSTDNLPTPPSPAIPTIKVSTESDGERERDAIAAFEDSAEGKASVSGGEVPGVEKPQTVHGDPEETPATTTTGAPETSASGVNAPGSFSNKRLCERWLDNLFMVLYEVRSLLPCPLSSADHYPPLDRTFVSTPSGELRSPISRRNTSPTARREPSGRSWASSPSGCTTRRRRRMPSNAPLTPSSRPRPGSSSSSSTPTRETCSAV